MNDYEFIRDVLSGEVRAPLSYFKALAALDRLRDERDQALILIGRFVTGEPGATATLESMRDDLAGKP